MTMILRLIFFAHKFVDSFLKFVEKLLYEEQRFVVVISDNHLPPLIRLKKLGGAVVYVSLFPASHADARRETLKKR